MSLTQSIEQVISQTLLQIRKTEHQINPIFHESTTKDKKADHILHSLDMRREYYKVLGKLLEAQTILGESGHTYEETSQAKQEVQQKEDGELRQQIRERPTRKLEETSTSDCIAPPTYFSPNPQMEIRPGPPTVEDSD
jgi:hypothetical protein